MSGKIQSTPVAQSIPFTDPSFTATNVKDALVEAKATTGGSGTYDENKILTSQQYDILVDMDGNVLRGS